MNADFYPFEDIDAFRPHGVDERGIPSSRKERCAPTRDLRVEAFQRLRAIRQMLAFLIEEVDEYGSMLCSMYGDPRYLDQRVRQPRATKRSAQRPTVKEAQEAARKAARAYRKAKDQGHDGP